eukprot:m.7738 g.7738  ORF g.7738 m.7738 type:complete len:295 (+) comp3764_c0_seq2:77-961(+)
MKPNNTPTGGKRKRPYSDSNAPKQKHPFVVEAADHCETPLIAYKDVAPALEKLAELMGKTKSTLKIYDPYFCAGGVKQHFKECGFPNVYNECEDFYQKINSNTIPDYDVLVTNPPYSTQPFDHIETLLSFCRKMCKPYMILQPVYVYMKEYYHWSVRPRDDKIPVGPLFITPSSRYTYRTPRGFRDVKAGDLATSPFVTMWFCEVGKYRSDILKWWCEQGKELSPGCKLRLSPKSLPHRFKDSNDKSRPRLRKKQRDAMRRRRAKDAGISARALKYVRKGGPRTFNSKQRIKAS